MNSKKGGNRGFTLVELLIVLAIIAVITAVTVPMLINYFRSSQMIKYNDYAKTIYLSAQSYLSDKKSAGKLADVERLTTNKVDSTMVKSEYFGGDDLSYMMLLKKGDDSDSKLKEMLKDYIGDPSILDESICVEYNAKEGVVYSVCYSESVDGFYYGMGGSGGDGQVSISDRDSEERERLRFGYYAAKVPSGKRSDTLKTTRVTLHNDNQLYASWTDARPNTNNITAEINYTVKVYGKKSKFPIMSFVVGSGQVKDKGTGELAVEKFLVECPTTYYKANGDKETASPQKQKHWIYSTGSAGNKIYSFVIDSIDTGAAGGNVSDAGKAGVDSSYHSVLKRYPKIGDKDIRVSVKSKSSNYRPNMVESTTKVENTLFAKEEKPGNDEDKQKIELSNARHLYNVRYKKSNENEFTQTSDISWLKALEEGAVVSSGKILNKGGIYVNGTGGLLKPEKDIREYAFEALNYKDSEGKEQAFTGIYDGKKPDGKKADEKYKIQGLYLTGQYDEEGKMNGITGLFARNKGTIKHVEMTDLTVRGYGEGTDKAKTEATGTIAGVNLSGGTITDVTIQAKEITGINNTGGLVGKNAGEITRGNTDCKVVGDSHVGGIVGLNEGKTGTEGIIADCNTTGGYIEGTGDNVGGIIGSNTARMLKIEGFKNKAEVKAKNYAGGIIGNNESGIITRCDNSGVVWVTESYAGGITGKNGTADSSSGETAKIVSCKSEVTKILTEAEQELRSQGNYVGGITGYNNGSITSTASEVIKIKSAVMGKDFVGGVVGHNDTKGHVAYYQLERGQVIASGDFAGGMFGLNTSRAYTQGSGGSVEMAFNSNPTLVKGNNYVGGVIGANLVVVGDQGEKKLKFASKGQGQKGDKLIANAYAGGIIGYNGVIEAGTDPDEQLKEALEELQKRNPFEDTEIIEPGSSIKTIVVDSHNFLDITAKRYVGGIIGLNSDASTLEVDGCINYGNLEVTSRGSEDYTGDFYYIGGITGRNSKQGIIRKSLNSGNITSLSTYTGGLTEVNEGQIIECVNLGTVSAEKGNVGGITGMNGTSQNGKAVVDNAKVDGGKVKGSQRLGGLVGENYGKVLNSSTPCGVVGEENKLTADYVGGLVGYNRIGGQLTGVECKGGSVNGRNYVGGIAGATETSVGSESGNQLINSAAVNGKENVGGIVGGMIGSENKTISNCLNSGKITGSKAGGITAENRSGDRISQCVNSGDVTVTGDYAGGIVSENRGTVTECTITGGTITGNLSAGGLIGYNGFSGIVENPVAYKAVVSNARIISKSTAVTGHYVGGLMAKNDSEKSRIIVNSGVIDITIEAVSANKNQYVGGIIGYNRAGDTVSSCSVTGTIKGGRNGTGGITGKNEGKISNINIGTQSDKVTISSSGISGGISGISAVTSEYAKIQNGYPLSVTGVKWVGGYFGKYECPSGGVTFDDWENRAKVNGNERVGGLTGEITGSTNQSRIVLKNCRNDGILKGSASATGTPQDIGGIIGLIADQNVTISSCANKTNGEVNADKTVNAGGVIGKVLNTAESGKSVSISECENRGIVKSNSASVGGIVGNVNSAATIDECVNYKSVTTIATSTGGIIGVAGELGNNTGIIKVSDCRNEGTVKSESAGDKDGAVGLGGIVGIAIANADNKSVTIADCFNGPKPIEGTTQVLAAALVNSTKGKETGGIAGRIAGTFVRVERSANAGTVKSANDLTGGIVGVIRDGGNIKSCSNFGRVESASGYLGGILGEGFSGAGKIEQCRNAGSIIGAASSMQIGGISGNLKGSLVMSECTNTIKGGISRGKEQVGGISGLLDGNAKIEQCYNEYQFLAGLNGIGSKFGGIVGKVTGNGTVQNCENRVSIQLAATEVGGIVGYMDGGTVKECTNSGEISQTTALAGGIVGNIVVNTKKNVSIVSNSNQAAVQAAAPVGGIIGQSKGSGGASLTVTACRNKAAITNEKAGSDGMGGLIGVVSGLSGEVSDSFNYGKVSQGEQTITMGGFVGSIQLVPPNFNFTVKNSANYGIVEKNGGNEGGTYGGIVGMLSDRAAIDSCYNFGEIAITKAAAVGGIAGNVGNKATVNRSVNSADIMVVNSDRLGGIAGDLSGKIISCQNTRLDAHEDKDIFTAAMTTVFANAKKYYEPGVLEAPVYGEDKGHIQAQSGGNVGGIVGRTAPGGAGSWISVASEIPTDDSNQTAYDCTKNTMTIKKVAAAGGGTIGGIIGHLNGGSVVKAYNTGAIEIGTGAVEAGGIAGKITRHRDNTSTIAGSFHLGTITAGNQNHKGGIAGIRNIDAAAGVIKPSVKDAFFSNGGVPETTIDGATKAWRIGNEGSEAVTETNGNDIPQRMMTDGQVVISTFDEEGFGKEHPDISAGVDFNDPGQAEALAKKYLTNYLYPLDMPEITDVNVTPESSDSYTVKWSGGQGSVGGYRLYYDLYDPEDMTQKVTTIQSADISPTADRISGQKFDAKYIGYFFEVGVQALGIAGESSESLINRDHKEKYMILPQMLLPELKCHYTGSQEYYFELVNYKDYRTEGKPDADLNPKIAPDSDRLKAIGENPAIPEYLQYQKAYKMYWSGLKEMEVTIKGDENPIVLKMARQPDGTFGVSHKFDIGTAIKKDYNVQVKAVPANLPPYAYYVSDTTQKITVEKTYKLETPDIKEIEYTGDLETPGYAVKFGAVTRGKQYKLDIYDGATLLKTYTITADQQPVKLDEIDFLNLLGKTLTVKLQALGHDTYYEESEVAEKNYTVVTRLPEPKITITPKAGSDQHDVVWNGVNGGLFDVTILQKEVSTDIETERYQQTSQPEQQTLIDYTDDPITNGYQLTAKVKQYGEQGKTLNSPVAELGGYNIYQRLPQVMKPMLKYPDETNLFKCNFDWSEYLEKNPVVTADTCSGYYVYATGIEDNKITEIAQITDVQNTVLEYEFPEENAGKTVTVYVIAVGKEGVKSNSMKGEVTPVNLPKRAEAPTFVAVQPSEPVNEVVSGDEYEQISYQATWEKPIAEGPIISSFNVRIVDESGMVVKSPQQMDLSQSMVATLSDYSYEFTVSAAYAGKVLKAQVQSVSIIGIDSLWEDAEVEFTTPKVKLEQVKDLKCAKQPLPGKEPEAFTYEISFTGVKYAQSYKVEALDATKPDAPPLYAGAVEIPGAGAKTHSITDKEDVDKIEAAIKDGGILKISVTSVGDGGVCYIDSDTFSIENTQAAPTLHTTLTDTPKQFKYSWVPDPAMAADKYKVRILRYETGSLEAPEVLFETDGTNDTLTEIILDYSGLPIAENGCELVVTVEQIDVWEEKLADRSILLRETSSMSAVWRSWIAP